MGMTMEESDDIGFHLRRHIHLTNCIHLRNHIHRKSPVIADGSLMKDLSLLQRSRSLKDPSTSSPPWNPVSKTATTTGSSFTRAGMGKVFHHGSRRRRRRSSIGGFDEPKHGRRPSSSSLPFSLGVSSKVSPSRILIGEDESMDSKSLSVRKHHVQYAADISLNSDEISERDENHTNLWCLKTLSEQFNDVRLDDDDAANFIVSLPNNVSNEMKSIRKSESMPRRRRTIKMNKKGGNNLRKSRASVYSRAVIVQNEASMATNSLAWILAPSCSKDVTGAAAEDYSGHSVTARGDENGNGCGGMHWNWSRIHNRGKSILDMAGRSLSCGISDPRPDKGCLPDTRGNDALDNASVYDSSSSSSISHYGDVLPLLMEASGGEAGLISTEKMVDLLDLAMSADTVNTVKYLREIMSTGVEPLSLISQLAAIVIDILGGNLNFINEKCQRKFFRHPKISKDDMEKLRQALKTLSEAEKQMRMSSDKSTWLTAAVLQLAPEQQHVLRESIKKQYVLPEFSYSSLNRNPKISSASGHDEDNDGESGMIRRTGGYNTSHINNFNGTSITPERKIVGSVSDDEIQEIWFKVLQKIQDKELKDFLCREGRLASIRPGAASIVELVFSSHQYKSKVEKLRGLIIKALEAVIELPVVVEITHQSLICLKTMDDPSLFQFSDGGLGQPPKHSNSRSKQRKHDFDINTFGRAETRLPVSESSKPGHCEIVEVASSSPGGVRGGSLEDEDHGGCNNFIGNVPLADMIQQTEGSRRRGGWSRGRAVSIAEKLEQGIMSVEPRSKSLFCWKRYRNSRHKLCKLRWRKAPCSLLRYVFCGRCNRSRLRRRLDQ